MRRPPFHLVFALAVVMTTSGLWLPLHFAVAHAPVAASAVHHDHHAYTHHHHDEPADESGDRPSPPDPHDCNLCDLLLTFSAAELTGTATLPVTPLAVDLCAVLPDRLITAEPLRSLGARAPPLG